jgi:hypothetical protein
MSVIEDPDLPVIFSARGGRASSKEQSPFIDNEGVANQIERYQMSQTQHTAPLLKSCQDQNPFMNTPNNNHSAVPERATINCAESHNVAAADMRYLKTEQD